MGIKRPWSVSLILEHEWPQDDNCGIAIDTIKIEQGIDAESAMAACKEVVAHAAGRLGMKPGKVTVTHIDIVPMEERT